MKQTMNAIPTRRGRPRRTHGMAEVFVCICGVRVEEHWTSYGINDCQCRTTSWIAWWLRDILGTCIAFYFCWLIIYTQVHLVCFNFTCAPKNWQCENDARSKKRARLGHVDSVNSKYHMIFVELRFFWRCNYSCTGGGEKRREPSRSGVVGRWHLKGKFVQLQLEYHLIWGIPIGFGTFKL